MSSAMENTLALARQGNPEAISDLMNSQLQARGITAQATSEGDHLQVLLRSASPFDQDALVRFVEKGMLGLGLTSIRTVEVIGQPANAETPVWRQELSLSTYIAPAPSEEADFSEAEAFFENEITAPDDVSLDDLVSGDDDLLEVADLSFPDASEDAFLDDLSSLEENAAGEVSDLPIEDFSLEELSAPGPDLDPLEMPSESGTDASLLDELVSDFDTDIGQSAEAGEASTDLDFDLGDLDVPASSEDSLDFDDLDLSTSENAAEISSADWENLDATAAGAEMNLDDLGFESELEAAANSDSVADDFNLEGLDQELDTVEDLNLDDLDTEGVEATEDLNLDDLATGGGEPVPVDDLSFDELDIGGAEADDINFDDLAIDDAEVTGDLNFDDLATASAVPTEDLSLDELDAGGAEFTGDLNFDDLDTGSVEPTEDLGFDDLGVDTVEAGTADIDPNLADLDLEDLGFETSQEGDATEDNASAEVDLDLGDPWAIGDLGDMDSQEAAIADLDLEDALSIPEPSNDLSDDEASEFSLDDFPKLEGEEEDADQLDFDPLRDPWDSMASEAAMAAASEPADLPVAEPVTELEGEESPAATDAADIADLDFDDFDYFDADAVADPSADSSAELNLEENLADEQDEDFDFSAIGEAAIATETTPSNDLSDAVSESEDYFSEDFGTAEIADFDLPEISQDEADSEWESFQAEEAAGATTLDPFAPATSMPADLTDSGPADQAETVWEDTPEAATPEALDIDPFSDPFSTAPPPEDQEAGFEVYEPEELSDAESVAFEMPMVPAETTEPSLPDTLEDSSSAAPDFTSDFESSDAVVEETIDGGDVSEADNPVFEMPAVPEADLDDNTDEGYTDYENYGQADYGSEEGYSQSDYGQEDYGPFDYDQAGYDQADYDQAEDTSQFADEVTSGDEDVTAPTLLDARAIPDSDSTPSVDGADSEAIATEPTFALDPSDVGVTNPFLEGAGESPSTADDAIPEFPAFDEADEDFDFDSSGNTFAINNGEAPDEDVIAAFDDNIDAFGEITPSDLGLTSDEPPGTEEFLRVAETSDSDSQDTDPTFSLTDLGATTEEEEESYGVNAVVTSPPEQRSGKNRLLPILGGAGLVLVGLAAFGGYKLMNRDTATVPTPAETPVETPAETPVDNESPAPETPQTPAPTPAADPFREAVNEAMTAAEAVQTAQTAAEWQAVAEGWERAIALMKQVPESNPNYATAQQKISDYQPNLDYAQQNYERLSSQ